MCGWECGGCWRGYCREIRGARSALLRCVLEEVSSSGPYPSPVYASLTPLSTACFSFSFCLPSGPLTDRPLKATPKPSGESSLSPLKGTEGTGTSGSGSPAGLGAGAGLAGATERAVVSAVFLVSISLFALLAQDSPRRAGCTARGCCRHTGAVCLLLPESFYESLSALIVPLLLLAAGVGFLLLVFDEENVLLMR